MGFDMARDELFCYIRLTGSDRPVSHQSASNDPTRPVTRPATVAGRPDRFPSLERILELQVNIDKANSRRYRVAR